eukprot:CAMPEP_0170167030 /NCGR_PEP_ID=MMETSP0040_2-20121228/546_1 /TAXON_ID=641309 /ORGANISM="Lotharella oceanica, Strain CCMP622" /LENGTH=180 /DNA_ID=CAMNT_0010404921 /DNA_START=95 /DNA_END=637 /DNA_ORIENTATION=-
MGDRQHIVIALDGDKKMSDHVLAWCAKMNILRKDHKITFLHVAEYHTVSYVTAADLGAFASSSVTSPRINVAMKKIAVDKGTEFLQECSKKAASLDLKPDELKLLIANQRTSVKVCIKNYLGQHNASAVICGSRGLSAVSRCFMGSVCDYLAHYASCATIIVKPPAEWFGKPVPVVERRS